MYFCVHVQSDQGLQYPLTQSLDIEDSTKSTFLVCMLSSPAHRPTDTFLCMVNVLKFHTSVCNKMTYANSTEADQTAPKRSDQDLHCLLFH